MASLGCNTEKTTKTSAVALSHQKQQLMLAERKLTKPLPSSAPPVPVSHGQFAPLSSIQDFSSSVVSNQTTVIFKWFPFYLKNFLFFPPLNQSSDKNACIKKAHLLNVFCIHITHGLGRITEIR